MWYIFDILKKIPPGKNNEIQITDALLHQAKKGKVIAFEPNPITRVILNENIQKNELKNINLIMGVGGSFDVIAGTIRRAPKYIQDLGLEWFYRFIQEPKRMWKRYLVGNSKFIYLVFKEKIRGSSL